jgi:hypothetical protein
MGQSNTWTGLPCFLWAQKYPARVRPASREKVTFRQKEKKETRASLGSSSRKGDRDLDKPAPALLRSSTLFSLSNSQPSSPSPCPPPRPARRTATTKSNSSRLASPRRNPGFFSSGLDEKMSWGGSVSQPRSQS